MSFTNAVIQNLTHCTHVEQSVASWTSSVVSQSPVALAKSRSCSSTGMLPKQGASVGTLTEKMEARYQTMYYLAVLIDVVTQCSAVKNVCINDVAD